MLSRFELIFAAQLAVNPRYTRYTLRFLRSMKPDHLLRAPEPWLVFAAIDVLDAMDLRGARVFEYGSGGSTLYWLKRGASCVSIEHDPAWYAMLRDRLGSAADVDYRLVLPVPGEPGADPADPDAYVSDEVRHRGLNFRDYCTQIDEFSDESFDIVVIDGRARNSCIKHAASKVRRGGLLIVDNNDRPHYFARTGQYLRDYDRLLLTGPVPSTPMMASTAILTRRGPAHG